MTRYSCVGGIQDAHGANCPRINQGTYTLGGVVKYDLTFTINQYEEQVVLSSIAYENGILKYRYVNCRGASVLGLGNCNCVNHDAVAEVEGEEAFERLSMFLEEQDWHIRDLMSRIKVLEGAVSRPVDLLEDGGLMVPRREVEYGQA